jgi:hypothetical protein
MKIKNFDFNEKNNKYSLIFASIVLVVFLGGLFCFTFSPIFTEATSFIGTIDSVYKYAKGEDRSDVRINFRFFTGSNSVIVTDTLLSGYAWGENVGWVNLYPGGGGIKNNGEGILSGYATSELAGWINFNGVTINSSGEFLGYATTEKLGRIIFNCATDDSCAIDDFKVKTDWRPVSIRESALPAPIYTTPANIPPPIFTSDAIPDEEDNPSTSEDLNNEPLPISDISQYQTGGDVIKKNVIKYEEGQININQLPNDLNVNLNSTSSQQEIEDTLENNSPDTNIITNIVKITGDVTNLIQSTTKQIKEDVSVITETPAVDISTKTVTSIGIVGGGTAIVSSFTSSLLSFSEFFLIFFRFWSLLLSALGLRKRREPWGTVYDSITKQPLDPAYVVLQDKNGKEIATSITDLDGRYGFLVPPGTYRMIANKTNYIAPSLYLHARERDELYDNLYFGEEIELGINKTITKNIPMDPQGFDWNEFAKRDKNIMKFHSPHKKFIFKIFNILFFAGLFFAIILFITKQDVYNIAILALYVFLIILRFVKTKPKSFGIITDKSNGFPLSFAIIRVYSESTGKEIFHRVADEYGYYYCLLAKGNYYITIEKKNNDESYNKVYTSDIINVKRGIINQDFSV